MPRASSPYSLIDQHVKKTLKSRSGRKPSWEGDGWLVTVMDYWWYYRLLVVLPTTSGTTHYWWYYRLPVVLPITMPLVDS